MEEERSPSRVEGAIERLNQDPYLLAAITAIPGVGGSITQVLTGIGQQIVQERNAQLFKQLSERLADVDERTIKRDYFETPEGFDLLIKALDSSRRTRSEEKRDFIARILRGAMLDYERGEYSPEEYLHLVSDLTARELSATSLLYDQYRRDPDTQIQTELWIQDMEGALGLDEIDARNILTRLQARGLVDVEWLEGTEDWDNPTRTIEIEPSFKKLMRFLEKSE